MASRPTSSLPSNPMEYPCGRKSAAIPAASRAFQRSRTRKYSASISGSLAGMTIDDGAERALADAAEGHVIAREHDAVDLRAIEGPRIVVAALEQANLPGVLGRGQELRFRLQLFAEQLRHLLFRPVLGPQPHAALLDA